LDSDRASSLDNHCGLSAVTRCGLGVGTINLLYPNRVTGDRLSVRSRRIPTYDDVVVDQ